MNQSPRTAAIVTVVAALLGLGIGSLAVNALASQGTDDVKAATTGPQQTVAPSQLINYGG